MSITGRRKPTDIERRESLQTELLRVRREQLAHEAEHDDAVQYELRGLHMAEAGRAEQERCDRLVAEAREAVDSVLAEISALGVPEQRK